MAPRGTSGGRETTPSRLPEGTPSLASPMDHSFTLQAVMDLTKTVSVLTEKVDRLRDDVGSLGTKIDTNCEKVNSINTRLAYVAGGAAVVVVFVIAIWSLVNLVPWSRISIAPAESAATRKH